MLKKNLFFRWIFFCLLSFSVISLYSCDDDASPEEPGEPEEPTPPPTPAQGRITSFSFEMQTNPDLKDRISFTVDETRKTITGVALYWNYSETPDRYTPSFILFNSKDKVFIGETEQKSGQMTHSFAEPLIYEVENEDGERTKYEVTFISPQLKSSLPVLRIEASADIVSKKDYVKAKLEITGNGITEGLWDFSQEDIEIRLRGNSTMYLPKRPYRIKFPEKYSPLGLDHAKEKSWVLLANDCDKSLLRTAVAFEMSRYLFANPTDLYDEKYTIPYTPSTVHVDVYLNDQYQGIYHFSDQNQQANGRIEVDKLAEKDGNNPDKITGGYIMEVDIHAQEGDYTTFLSDRRVKMTHKYPDDEDYHESQYEYIREHINQAERVLYKEDTQEDWKKYFDMETAINFMLVNEFCGDPDAYTSIWMYKRRGCNKIFFGPVWDFDSAFDNDNRISNAVNRMMLEASFHCITGDHWFLRMSREDEFKAAAKARWNNVKDQLRDIAYHILEQEPARMGTSLTANYTRWNITQQALDTANPAPSGYEAEIKRIKSFIETRYKYLDTQFNNW